MLRIEFNFPSVFPLHIQLGFANWIGPYENTRSAIPISVSITSTAETFNLCRLKHFGDTGAFMFTLKKQANNLRSIADWNWEFRRFQHELKTIPTSEGRVQQVNGDGCFKQYSGKNTWREALHWIWCLLLTVTVTRFILIMRIGIAQQTWDRVYFKTERKREKKMAFTPIQENKWWCYAQFKWESFCSIYNFFCAGCDFMDFESPAATAYMLK